MAKNRKHKIKNIRVRFAPSPTGYLHIGGLRTYLYNWLFAKKNKGEIILRIEDTDRKRLVDKAVNNFIEILKNIDLPWDKGPIFQSENLKKYQEKVKELVDKGRAYYCFCSKERLDKLREKQKENNLPPRYDGHCRDLNQKQVKDKIDQGLPYVIRLKVPEDEENIVFEDVIRGKITYNTVDIDDQILLKSDGWPTYHLANVIDDHDMGISHVIRGEEWLSSTPKHIILYNFFNWQLPKFVHVPLLLNKDHSKLSKRQGDVSVGDFLKKGYLKQPLINFLALLGWNPGTEQEIFTLNELINSFSLKKIQKSGAIFNIEKLNWINGRYIRKMNLDDLVHKVMPFLRTTNYFQEIDKGSFKAINGREFDISYIKSVVSIQRNRMNTLKDIIDLSRLFFQDIDYSKEILNWKLTSDKKTITNLKIVKDEFDKISLKEFNANKIQDILKNLADKYGTGDIFWPTRVALSCQKNSPQPNKIAATLGKELSIKRIEKAINKLKNE